VVETLHHKIIKSKSLLILLLFHKTLGHPTNQSRKGKEEKKKEKERKERRQWQDTKAKSAKAGLG